MSYLQDLYRNMRAVTAIRPEQKAVPSTLKRTMLRDFGRSEGQRRAGEMNFGTRVGSQNLRLGEMKRDIRLARRDAPIALAVEAGNTLLALKQRQQALREAERETQRNKEIEERLKGFEDIISEYPYLFQAALAPGDDGEEQVDMSFGSEYQMGNE